MRNRMSSHKRCVMALVLCPSSADAAPVPVGAPPRGQSAVNRSLTVKLLTVNPRRRRTKLSTVILYSYWMSQKMSPKAILTTNSDRNRCCSHVHVSTACRRRV